MVLFFERTLFAFIIAIPVNSAMDAKTVSSQFVVLIYVESIIRSKMYVLSSSQSVPPTTFDAFGIKHPLAFNDSISKEKLGQEVDFFSPKWFDKLKYFLI